MRVDQKIRLQHIYSGFLIFNSNNNSSDVTVLLYPTIFPHSTNRTWGIHHIVQEALLFPVLCPELPAIMSKLLSLHYYLQISGFLQHWKEMKIVQQLNRLIKSQSMQVLQLQICMPSKFIFWSTLVHYII